MSTERDFAFGIVPIYKSDDGIILFCVVKRTAGYWEFPKGHKEGAESDEETARREFCEEVDINNIDIVPQKQFIETYSFEKDDISYKKDVTYYIGEVSATNGKVSDSASDEIAEILWLPLEQTINRLTFPGAKRIAGEVADYLRVNKYSWRFKK